MPAPLVTRVPGVTLESVLRSPRPEFATGVPAFLALAGIPVQAQLFGGRQVVQLDVSTWSHLEAAEGVHWAMGYLGFAVRGFFENGGRRCYVVAPTQGGLAESLAALDLAADFDLVCVPDLVSSALSAEGMNDAAERQVQVLSECLRRGGCFAILDSVGSSTPSGDVHVQAVSAHHTALVNKLSTLTGADRGALYTPWIKVRDACQECAGTGIDENAKCLACGGSGAGFVPPCGHLAGIYALTDGKVGFHKPPANEVVEGALDVQLHIKEAEQAAMDRAINCLRFLPGRGLRVWGARTLSSDSHFQQVHVRRLVLTVGRFLSNSAANVVFESNNLQLWARMRREVGAFLDGLFRRGALFGASPEEAYFVKCDAENNPQTVIDAGEIVTEVGIAPARASEFIVVRLVSNTEGAIAATTGGT